jgi:hypothetical protein
LKIYQPTLIHHMEETDLMNPITKTTRQHGLRLVALSLLVLAVLFGASSATYAAPDAQERVQLPLVVNPACFGMRPQTPFAVQIYGDSGSRSRYFTPLLESGASWVRVQLNWSSVEPTNQNPPQYNWASADRVVAAAKDGCINVILTHSVNPDWAATEIVGPIDKVSLERFVQYFSAVVERYNGDGVNDAPGSPIVNNFEFYNEPDSGISAFGEAWGFHGDKYADLLKAVYPAVKATNPNAVVIFGGIAYDGFTENGGAFVRHFLDDVLDAGGGPFFDVMNFHQYPIFAGSWTSGNGPGLIEKAAAVRQILANHGLTKPLIITETSWWNNSPPNAPASNDEIQSRYVVALFVQGLAADIGLNTWWPLADIGPSYQYNTGLVTADNPPVRKPALNVFALMTRELAAVQFVRTLPAAETGNPDLEVHQFNDLAAGQTLYVAWLNPVSNTGLPAAPLQLGATVVEVKDMYGAVSSVNDGADGASDGRVTVPVDRPVYIRVVQ